MFAKSSDVAVTAFKAFVFVGALLFGQSVLADCIFFTDLSGCFGGSVDSSGDPNTSEGKSIHYLVDDAAIAGAEDENGDPIFPLPGFTAPPRASLEVSISPTSDCPSVGNTVALEGHVVGLATDKFGNLIPESASSILFKAYALDVSCSINSDGERVYSATGAAGDMIGDNWRTDSKIVVEREPSFANLLPNPIGYADACSDRHTGQLLFDCEYPLGLPNLPKEQDVIRLLTATKEYFHGEQDDRNFKIVLCKGDGGMTADPETLTCRLPAGGVLVELYAPIVEFSGSTASASINPNSGFDWIDFIHPFAGDIQTNSLTGRIDNLSPVLLENCVLKAEDRLSCKVATGDLFTDSDGACPSSTVTFEGAGKITDTDAADGFIRFRSLVGLFCK